MLKYIDYLLFLSGISYSNRICCKLTNLNNLKDQNIEQLDHLKI